MKRLLLIFILTVAPAFAQTGNLWVGASGTCTRVGTPATYNAATSCSSFQAAQTAATGGDTVMVLNGTYSAQNLTSGAKSTTVNFIAQTTGSVIVGGGGLTINIDKIHLFGIVGGAASLGTNRPGLDIEDLTNTAFTDVVVNCGNPIGGTSTLGWKNFFAAGSFITVTQCDIGNWNACDGYSPTGPTCTGNCAIEDATRFWSWGIGSALQPNNDTLSNDVVHDVSAPPDGACGGGAGVPHVDALQVFSGGSNMVINANKFYGNASSALQSGGGTLSNWTVTNNYFGETTCCNNLVWGQASVSGSFTVKNNTNANPNGYLVVNNASASGTATYDFSSNLTIAAPTVCQALGSTSGAFNVFPSTGGATCGTNTKRCNPTFLNGTPSAGNGYDIRLAPSDTCAIGAGNASDFASTDIFGTTRPQGGSVDAGAYELPVSTNTTWYIRTDGGTNSQCTGTTNAAYPGSGTGVSCAYNHPYQLMNSSGGWAHLVGGDTIQFIKSGASDTYFMGEQNSGVGTDWHSQISSICPAANSGSAASSCILPTLPSGTSSQHTRVLGQNVGSCHDSGHTHLVNPTILSGISGAFAVLDVRASNYVDIDCIAVTQPDSCTAVVISPGQCNSATSNYVGFGGLILNYFPGSVKTGPSNLTLTDFAAVGISSSGILGGSINTSSSDTTTWNDVYIIGNGQAGYNADSGGCGTSCEDIGTWNINHMIVDWNGAVPVAYDFTKSDTANAFNYATDQQIGGYGDGFVVIAANNVNLNVTNSFFRWNTQDGFDSLHLSDDPTHSPSINIQTSWSEGNEGQTFKLGAGSTATAINNMSINNCLVLGTASNFPLNPTGWNTSLIGSPYLCRAQRDEWAFQLNNTTVVTLENNTSVGYGTTMYDVECSGATGQSACAAGGAKFVFNNNISYGFQDPGNSNRLPSGFFLGTGVTTAIFSGGSANNLWHNMFASTGCPDSVISPTPTNSQCGDPAMVSESNINAMNPNLTSGSPAIANGEFISGITTDYNGATRPNPPAIGAFEFSGTTTVATPTCSPAPGTYSSTQSITCSSTTSSSTTVCTINGSTPTHASPVCTAISISSTATLKALSFATGDTDSSIPSYVYTITISPHVVSIAIAPTSSTINVGASTGLTCTATYSDSSTAPCPSPVWTSGTPSHATVNSSTGVVTGVAAGTSGITAAASGFTSNTSTITVQAVTQTGITFGGKLGFGSTLSH